MGKANEMYQCQVHYCGYTYDPEVGDPKRNISAGTKFEDLPKSWTCPFCGAHKDMFKPLSGPGSVLWENLRHNAGMARLSDEEIAERVGKSDVQVQAPDAAFARKHKTAPADH